jgi:hypothetical protein
VLPAVGMQEPLGLLHDQMGELHSICPLQHDGSYGRELFGKSLVVRVSCVRDALHAVSGIYKHKSNAIENGHVFLKHSILRV